MPNDEALTTEGVRSPSMIRTYTLADALTIANASCGTVAIFLCLDFMAFGDHRRLWVAMALPPAALLFDILDGYVARLTPRRQSVLGADLDSLADVISFGLGPAALGYTLGFRGGWDMICLTFFVVCGVSRLARFNATAAQFTTVESKKVSHFEGTPIPTSIVIVGLLALLLWNGHVQGELWLGAIRIGPMLLHPLVLIYVLSGSAMISTIRIPKP